MGFRRCSRLSAGDLGRDDVAHQALLWPVVCVGVALTRPLCDAGPRRPEDEASQLLGLLLAIQSHVLVSSRQWLP